MLIHHKGTIFGASTQGPKQLKKKQARVAAALDPSAASWHPRHLLNKNERESVLNRVRNATSHRTIYQADQHLLKVLCKGSFIAKHSREKFCPASSHTIKELVNAGYDLIDWNGLHVSL